MPKTSTRTPCSQLAKAFRRFNTGSNFFDIIAPDSAIKLGIGVALLRRLHPRGSTTPASEALASAGRDGWHFGAVGNHRYNEAADTATRFKLDRTS